jgi:hypothetical protein
MHWLSTAHFHALIQHSKDCWVGNAVIIDHETLTQQQTGSVCVETTDDRNLHDMSGHSLRLKISCVVQQQPVLTLMSKHNMCKHVTVCPLALWLIVSTCIVT